VCRTLLLGGCRTKGKKKETRIAYFLVAQSVRLRQSLKVAAAWGREKCKEVCKRVGGRGSLGGDGDREAPPAGQRAAQGTNFLAKDWQGV